jgi:predicted transcriptional regulator
MSRASLLEKYSLREKPKLFRETAIPEATSVSLEKDIAGLGRVGRSGASTLPFEPIVNIPTDIANVARGVTALSPFSAVNKGLDVVSAFARSAIKGNAQPLAELALENPDVLTTIPTSIKDVGGMARAGFEGAGKHYAGYITNPVETIARHPVIAGADFLLAKSAIKSGYGSLRGFIRSRTIEKAIAEEVTIQGGFDKAITENITGQKASEAGHVINPQEVASNLTEWIKDPSRRANVLFSESMNRAKLPETQAFVEKLVDTHAERYLYLGDYLTQFRKGVKSTDLFEQISDEAQRLKVQVKDTKVWKRIDAIEDNLLDLDNKLLETPSSDLGAIDKINGAITKLRSERVQLSKQAWRPFNPRKKFFTGEDMPRMLKEDILESLFDDIASVDKAIKKYSESSYSPVDVRVMNQIRNKAMDKMPLSAKTQQAVEHIMKRESVSFNDAYRMLKAYITDEKFNPFGNLEKQRGELLPSTYYEADVNKVLPRYIWGASRTLSEVKNFGPMREKAINALADLRMKDPADHVLAKDLWDLSTGMWELDRPISPKYKKFMQELTNFEVITKIGFGTATLPNIFQTGISTAVKAPVHEVFKGGWKYATDAEFRQMVRSTGATAPEAMQMFIGGEGTDLSTKTARVVLYPFNIFNRANKAMAASTAIRWIPDLYNQANGGGLRADFAKRQLKSLSIDWEKPLVKHDIRKGAFRFASDTQLQRDIAKEPIWFNDPRWRPFALFKRFGYRQFNFIRREVGGELRHGNPMPLLRLAINGQLGGELVYDSKLLLRHWLSGNELEERDENIWKRAFNNYAAMGTMGLFSDIRFTEGQEGNIGRNIASSIVNIATPTILGEAVGAGEKLVRTLSADDKSKQGVKEVAGVSPLSRMFAKRLDEGEVSFGRNKLLQKYGVKKKYPRIGTQQ